MLFTEKEKINEIEKGMVFMKKLMCLAAAALITVVMPVSSFAAELPERSISVTGTGIVKATPDIAQINLSIETTAVDAETAQTENNAIYKKACDALKALGINESDIKSSWYNVSPNVDYENGKVITGYTVYNNFSVTTEDKDNTGKYIDAALKAGVTGADGVSFSVKNPQDYYNSALKLAIDNAEKSANAIGNAIGAGNLTVYSVQEQQSGYSYSSSSKATAEMAVNDYGAGNAATEISYDDIEISARVNAVYVYN